MLSVKRKGNARAAPSLSAWRAARQISWGCQSVGNCQSASARRPDEEPRQNTSAMCHDVL